MKKLLLLIGIMLITAGAGFAAGSPRWRFSSLTVYMPPSSEAAIVQNAFSAWENASGGILRFKVGTRRSYSRYAHITVNFIDALAPGQYYDIMYDIYRTGFTTHKESSFVSDYFYKVNLRIRTKDENYKRYTDEQLYAITLQAVGRALGVDYVDKPDNVMSRNLDFEAVKITADDKSAFMKVYR